MRLSERVGLFRRGALEVVGPVRERHVQDLADCDPGGVVKCTEATTVHLDDESGARRIGRRLVDRCVLQRICGEVQVGEEDFAL